MTSRESQGFLEDDANIQRLCALGGVSRAGYYRHFGPHPGARDDADLRDLIQRIALDDRHCGYRRIARKLKRDHGLIVNAKRVLRLMREDNLLCLRVKPFVPRTTDSRHGFAIRPNLIRGATPTGLDQIWVADITYVRLAEAFVYLAVVIDAFSRKVVGWALDDHLEARLAIAALDQAIAARNPAPESLIHHSDRGVQYACADYIERLEARRIAVSMSRPANPYDNAKAESFVYLAVAIDAFSRKVVGWALDDHLEARLAIAALDQAIAARNPPPESLIHHSDRGVQYACGDYIDRLEARKIAISMSRPANPYDNAKAESFMKTLKTEEVNGKAYKDLEDARQQIGAFIETAYNTKRLHSALGDKPPVEFEEDLGPAGQRQRDEREHLSLN